MKHDERDGGTGRIGRPGLARGCWIGLVRVPFNRIELSSDAGDTADPKVEACVDLALELVGWADSDKRVRADVSVDLAARGNIYNGRIQSDFEPRSYTWTCDVRAPGDSTMTAVLTELRPG